MEASSPTRTKAQPIFIASQFQVLLATGQFRRHALGPV
jgi:hypothetical protein